MFTCAGLLELHKRAYQSFESLLNHIAAMPAEALLRPLTGFGFETLRDTLVHLASAEDWWITTARAKPFVEWNKEAFSDIEALREALHGVEQRTREYLESLHDEQLTEPVTMSYEGGSFTTAPAWIILHMVTHGFHHKGQCAAMCRMLGSPTPDTDLGVGL